ncbi:alpha/beta fold hydrolase [Streptomyces sp. NPDC021212]|uniref:alpha/beta fold hydrolase n=1 Tax=Streptomyces sp. NPDC021212 TaxID=3365118 RepID=UPI0037A67DA6
MQPLTRALAGALTAAALVLGAGVADADTSVEAGRPSSTSPEEPPSSIGWKPCPENGTPAECGTLRLPIDWARPGGEKFGLAVARLTAADPDRRVGVLLVNPGGPGESGVNFVRQRAETYFSADVRARFDIVGFDPRGIGASSPVTCSQGLLDRQPSPYPRDQAEFDRLVAYNRELREDCRRHSGPIFDHADTLGVVRDMEAFRRSLGEQKITYFGHSYGTLIGEQYAELYGDRIRAMALTANIDHSLGARDFLVSSAATAEDSFRQFVRWCDRSPSCALHGRNVTAVWDGLLARADRGEIRDPDHPDQALTANAITRTAFTMFYGPDWDQLAAYVAELDAQTAAAPGPATASDTTRETKESEAFPAVFCQDWRIRARNYPEYARLTAAELRAAPHMRGSPRVHAGVAGCLGWPDQVNNPQHRLRITKAPKILLMHSRHDPANNYSWVTHVHRQTRGTTVLLTYEGAGHSVYGRSDCTRGAADGYLTALKVPDDGSRCAAVEPVADPGPAPATSASRTGP